MANRFLALFILGMCSSFSFAAMAQTNLCQADEARFCSEQKEASERTTCLIKHAKDVSPSCRADLERMIKARQDAAYRGGGALTSFGGLNAMGAPIPLFSYDGRYEPKQNGPTFVENKVNLSAPVYQGSTDTVGVSLAGGDLHIGEPLHFDTGAAVPQDLSRVEVGAQYFHKMQDKRTWSVRASLGYASDKAFDELSFGLSGTYGFPSSDPNGYWIIMAFVGNNNSLLNYVPIPGFAYVYHTPTLTGVFGFPVLMLQWTPVKPWIYSFSAFGPSIQAEAAYGDLSKFQVFTQYAYGQQSYIPDQRIEDRDRLIIREEKVGAGFRLPLWHQVLTEVQAGCGFDRAIFIGKSVFKEDHGIIHLGPDWFVNWGFKLTF